MGSKKIIFLFLGLLMPVLVFVFLRQCGKNQFDVPLLHDQTVEAPGVCNYNYPIPYSLPDSIQSKLYNNTHPLTLLNFFGEQMKLTQISQEFNELQIVEERTIDLTADELERIKTCFLLVKDTNMIVLVDQDRRIRGYYDGNDLDELDRLEAEVKILLKRY